MTTLRAPIAALASLPLALALGLAAGDRAWTQTPLPAEAEIEIKASFVYTLAKFVTWPSRAFPHSASPFVFCTLGDDPERSALERISSGKRLGGRTVLLQTVKLPQDIDACHVLLVGSSAAEWMAEVLARSRRGSILTLGEEEGFTARGGMVRIHMNEDMVQAEVNEETVERAGLRISSNFLRLSGIVTVSAVAGPR